jgi:predicted nucleic acid-binding protein
MEKIMLDTNVFSRPLDDLSDKSVKLEAESSKKIFGFARDKTVSIATSEILFYEIGLIKEKDKREVIFHLAKNVEKYMIFINPDIEKVADDLQTHVKDYADCLHIALAALSGCGYLVTCDKELLRKAEKIESFLLSLHIKVHIVNPVKIVSIIGEQNGN